MGFLKSIRGFFVSIYETLKNKVKAAYVVISGCIFDKTTGEVIEEIQPKNITEAFKMFLTDSVCGHGTSSKPSTLEEKAVKALKFFGLGFVVSTALIVLAEGIVALSFIYLLKVMVLWYLCSLIFQAAIYQYKSFEWAFDKAPVSNGIVEGEVLAITYDEAVADEETFDNKFFTSEEEEKKFHHELADFVRSKNLRPELAYYMFCYDKKAEHTKLDNDMTNFLMVPDNSEAVIKFIGRYPKLSKSIMPNGYLDATCSKSFNRYLLPIMFEPKSSLTLARYTKYFYRLVKI